jgi:hypothetical protein
MRYSASDSIEPPLSPKYRRTSSRTAYFVGQRGQCLTSGSAAAFKGAVIGIEDGSTKVCFSVWVSMSTKPASAKSDCSRVASPSAKVRVIASVRLGTLRAYKEAYDEAYSEA